ncbi:amidohydrolase family protein [Paracoccus zhejiangensis]|uniref:amidohydrolase family protein n=1 Tax=Paracoccus zhejiangensis TaxID=1077935 RepID=UPI0038CD67BC
MNGSPQGFTAWRDQPYYAPAGDYPKGYSGYASITLELFIELVDWSYANNFPVITHANGEKASDLLIEGLAAAEAKHGKGDRRPVLIHGQFERFDQIAKFNALGVIPSLFPMHIRPPAQFLAGQAGDRLGHGPLLLLAVRLSVIPHRGLKLLRIAKRAAVLCLRIEIGNGASSVTMK